MFIYIVRAHGSLRHVPSVLQRAGGAATTRDTPEVPQAVAGARRDPDSSRPQRETARPAPETPRGQCGGEELLRVWGFSAVLSGLSADGLTYIRFVVVCSGRRRGVFV